MRKWSKVVHKRVCTGHAIAAGAHTHNDASKPSLKYGPPVNPQRHVDNLRGKRLGVEDGASEHGFMLTLCILHWLVWACARSTDDAQPHPCQGKSAGEGGASTHVRHDAPSPPASPLATIARSEGRPQGQTN